MRREQRSGQAGRDARRERSVWGRETVKRASWYPKRRKKGHKGGFAFIGPSLFTAHAPLPSFAVNLQTPSLVPNAYLFNNDSRREIQSSCILRNKKIFYSSKLFQRVRSSRLFTPRLDRVSNDDAKNNSRGARATHFPRIALVIGCSLTRKRERENAITS